MRKERISDHEEIYLITENEKLTSEKNLMEKEIKGLTMSHTVRCGSGTLQRSTSILWGV